MKALFFCLLLFGCSIFEAPARPVSTAGSYSITHWNSEGKPISVSIRPVGCTKADGFAYTHVISEDFAVINLCGLAGLKDHELAHVAGMQHTEWKAEGNSVCAKVTIPGTKTKYKIDQKICHVEGRELWSDK